LTYLSIHNHFRACPYPEVPLTRIPQSLPQLRFGTCWMLTPANILPGLLPSRARPDGPEALSPHSRCQEIPRVDSKGPRLLFPANMPFLSDTMEHPIVLNVPDVLGSLPSSRHVPFNTALGSKQDLIPTLPGRRKSPKSCSFTKRQMPAIYEIRTSIPAHAVMKYQIEYSSSSENG
jgi:hypothetical protein